MEQFGNPKKEQNETQHSTKQDDNSEKSLECPVCLEGYNEGLHTPKMMPCLHTICADCLVGLTSSASTTRGTHSSSTSGTSLIFPQHGFFNLGGSRSLGSSSSTLQPGLFSCRENRQAGGLRGILSEVPPIPFLLEPIPSTIYHFPHPLVNPPPRTQPPPNPPPRTPQSTSQSSPPKPDNHSEPVIPKNVQIRCPVCRSVFNTSKLQTNRYILAHLKDLTRLSVPTTPPDSTSDAPTMTSSDASAGLFKPLNDFRCEDCKRSPTSVCNDQKCIHAKEWMETERAVLESLQLEVETKLEQHITYLNELKNITENIYDSLNKSSKFILEAYDQVGGFKEEMKNLMTLPTTENFTQRMEALLGKVKGMERLAERVSKEDHLMSGNAEVTVTFQQSGQSQLLQQEVFIRTNNPKQLLTLTVTQKYE